jgi:rare lipoprotein A (peptidoglycan hydrolase)
MTRAAVAAAAMSLIVLHSASVEPAAAQQTDTTGSTKSAPIARVASLAVGHKRLDVRSGRRVKVVGKVRPRGDAKPRGLTARLQIKVRDRWATIDRDRTGRRGRYKLRDRRHAPMSAKTRVKVRNTKRKVGRMNVYRWAHASWYGPGLYGNRTGCGGTLIPGRLGVAHKSLPCGTKLTLRHNGRTVRVQVMDRGPYIAGREYDLTEATANRLRFRGHGSLQTTR